MQLGNVRSPSALVMREVEKSTPVIVALPCSYLNDPLTGFVHAAISASRAVFIAQRCCAPSV